MDKNDRLILTRKIRTSSLLKSAGGCKKLIPAKGDFPNLSVILVSSGTDLGTFPLFPSDFKYILKINGAASFKSACKSGTFAPAMLEPNGYTADAQRDLTVIEKDCDSNGPVNGIYIMKDEKVALNLPADYTYDKFLEVMTTIWAAYSIFDKKHQSESSISKYVLSTDPSTDSPGNDTWFPFGEPLVGMVDKYEEILDAPAGSRSEVQKLDRFCRYVRMVKRNFGGVTGAEIGQDLIVKRIDPLEAAGVTGPMIDCLRDVITEVSTKKAYNGHQKLTRMNSTGVLDECLSGVIPDDNAQRSPQSPPKTESPGGGSTGGGSTGGGSTQNTVIERQDTGPPPEVVLPTIEESTPLAETQMASLPFVRNSDGKLMTVKVDVKKILDETPSGNVSDVRLAQLLLVLPEGKLFWDPDNRRNSCSVIPRADSLERTAYLAMDKLTDIIHGRGMAVSGGSGWIPWDDSRGQIDAIYKFCYDYCVLHKVRQQYKNRNPDVTFNRETGLPKRWLDRRRFKAFSEVLEREYGAIFFKEYKHYGGSMMGNKGPLADTSSGDGQTPQARQEGSESGVSMAYSNRWVVDTLNALKESDPVLYDRLTGGKKGYESDRERYNEGKVDHARDHLHTELSDTDLSDKMSSDNRECRKSMVLDMHKGGRAALIKTFNYKSKRNK